MKERETYLAGNKIYINMSGKRKKKKRRQTESLIRRKKEKIKNN